MKTIYATILALLTVFALPALADSTATTVTIGDQTYPATITAQGCTLIDKGNGQFTYLQGCPVIGAKFNLDPHGRSGLVDLDGDGVREHWVNDLEGWNG